MKWKKKSPVEDLKRPFNNRLRRDSGVCGAIELAYLRGYHEGLGLHRALRAHKERKEVKS
jgi:hypothetical protein